MRRIAALIFVLALSVCLRAGAITDITGVTTIIGKDTTFPTNVTLTLPGLVSGLYEDGTVAWSATCTDWNIASVSLVAAGVVVATDTNGGDGWGGSWMTEHSADAARLMQARCTDQAGNKTNSTAQTVTIDVTAPTITNVAAIALDATQIGIFYDTFEATSGFPHVEFLRCNPSPCTPTAWQTSLDDPYYATGFTGGVTYDFQLRATDQVGNSGVSSVVTASLNDLVAYFPLESNAADSSITANNGVVNGSPVFAPGEVGNWMTLDGVDDYALVPHNTAYDITTNLTVAAWVSCQSVCQTLDNWVAMDSTANRRWTMRIDGVTNTKIEFFIVSGDVERVAEFATGWTVDSVPHYVTGTYNGANVRLYVDAVLRHTFNHTGTIDTDVVGIGLGARHSATQLAAGALDEVRIFKRTLSALEINYLMTMP